VDILKREILPWLIILFSSLVKGNFRKDSDIDIAYLSDKEISNVERFWVSQEIADSLNRDIDLIDLKKASTVLKAQIVGTGEVIYCEDEKRKNLFFMRALKEYAFLNLQRAIEAAIDIAMHLCAVFKFGVPQSSREAFDLLEEKMLCQKSWSKN